jgi:hypothetical protein
MFLNFGVLKFLECILYIMVNSVWYLLHDFLCDLFQDFLFEQFFVGITWLLSDIYDCFVGVSNLVSIFFNRKIVMVKLIAQKENKNKNTRYCKIKCSVCWVKVLELFLWHPILVLVYKWEL